MITFEDIKKVNETIKTIDVKGKEYSAVNERIKAFRMNHPLGTIATNIERLEDGVVVMSCEVKDENGQLLGKAFAYEKENSTFINKTSFIENCCTSATGRALGYAGYGIDLSVCSAEEVQNAIANQNKDSIEDLEGLIKETETNEIELLEHYGKTTLKELTPEEIIDARTILLKKMKNTNFKK